MEGWQGSSEKGGHCVIPAGGRGPRWSSGRQREPPVKASGCEKAWSS